jgi:hypothetical protein
VVVVVVPTVLALTVVLVAEGRAVMVPVALEPLAQPTLVAVVVGVVALVVTVLPVVPASS